MLPALPTGMASTSGAPPRSSQISKAAVFWPSRRNGLTELTRVTHTYWVSVQANMSFGTEGQWGWLTNNTVQGASSVWRQPGNGAGTGCTTYTTTTTCLAAGEGGDFTFAVGH